MKFIRKTFNELKIGDKFMKVGGNIVYVKTSNETVHPHKDNPPGFTNITNLNSSSPEIWFGQPAYQYLEYIVEEVIDLI